MREMKLVNGTRGWLLAAPLAMAACGGAAPELAMESEPAASAPASTSDGPRVFFVSPEDGRTYPANLTVPFEFGIENYDLSAVPEEVDQPRPGMGHHHLGVDADCLSPGEVIPQGNPSWIHFGDASTTIEMMLEPGEHMMVLQLGDDEHRAQSQDGLCASVTFWVEEGI